MGNHGYGAFGNKRELLDPAEMPTIDPGSESIVATNAFFIGRGDLKRSWGGLLKRPFFNVGAARVTAVTLRGDLSVWTGRR